MVLSPSTFDLSSSSSPSLSSTSTHEVLTKEDVHLRFSTHYRWNRDSFSLTAQMEPLPHLTGSSDFGSSQDDHNVLVALLLALSNTSAAQNCIVTGSFHALLAELSAMLPEWASSPEKTQNRFFFYRGRLCHISPTDVLLVNNQKGMWSLIEREYRFSFPLTRFHASTALQRTCEEFLVRSIRQACRVNVHATHLLLTPCVAVLLETHTWLSTWCTQAFDERDLVETRQAQRYTFSSPVSLDTAARSLLPVRLQLTRLSVATLLSQPFQLPRSSGCLKQHDWAKYAALTPQSAEFTAFSLGVKMMVGLEILLARWQRKRDKIDLSALFHARVHTDHGLRRSALEIEEQIGRDYGPTSMLRWHDWKRELSRMNLLTQQALECEHLNQLHAAWAMFLEDEAKRQAGGYTKRDDRLTLLQLDVLNLQKRILEQWYDPELLHQWIVQRPSSFSELPKADSLDWLNEMLESKGNTESLNTQEHQYKVATQMNAFMSQSSGVDGIEPIPDQALPAHSNNCGNPDAEKDSLSKLSYERTMLFLQMKSVEELAQDIAEKEKLHSASEDEKQDSGDSADLDSDDGFDLDADIIGPDGVKGTVGEYLVVMEKQIEEHLGVQTDDKVSDKNAAEHSAWYLIQPPTGEDCFDLLRDNVLEVTPAETFLRSISMTY